MPLYILTLYCIIRPFDAFEISCICKYHKYKSIQNLIWERSGSVVECLTRDRRAPGSSLTGAVTALWSLSKTHLS